MESTGLQQTNFRTTNSTNVDTTARILAGRNIQNSQPALRPQGLDGKQAYVTQA